MMESVSQILDRKGYEIYSIHPDAKVYEALEIMAKKEIGALLVIDEENICGIFSERDYARKVALFGKSSKNLAVKEIMSARIYYVAPEQSVEDCMALMIKRRIRHLPVIKNNKLLGVISIGDVVKAIIGEKEFMIEQLVHYITGTPSLGKN
ncbi:MAG: CBS domain-containing protein [Ignavibacteriaceae bacterium]